MITEDYVSFETAKLLKEKGFEGDTSCYFVPNSSKRWTYQHYHDFDKKDRIECPTLQMAMKWLRKEHYCHIIIDYTFTADANLSEEYVSYCYKVENAKTYIQHTQDEWYNTSEEACDAAIQYCLKNLI